jgi:hypothetical protein
VIKIAITVQTFDALASTLPLGSVAYAKNLYAKGECHVWLAPTVVNRLTAMRKRGKSYSDAILRLVTMEGAAAP